MVRQSPKCSKGFPCSNSCINRNYKCESSTLHPKSNLINNYVMYAKRVNNPIKTELKNTFKELKGGESGNRGELLSLVREKTIGLITKKLEANSLNEEDTNKLYNKILDNSPQSSREYLEKYPKVAEALKRSLSLSYNIGDNKIPWEDYKIEFFDDLVVEGFKVEGFHNKDTNEIKIQKREESVITSLDEALEMVCATVAHEIAHSIELQTGPSKIKEALEYIGIEPTPEFEGNMGKMKIPEGEVSNKYAKVAYKDSNNELYATELISTLFELIINNPKYIIPGHYLNKKGEPLKQFSYAWMLLFNEQAPWNV